MKLRYWCVADCEQNMGGKTGNPTLEHILCIDFREFDTKTWALWRCVVCAVLWIVWLERSTRIFLREKVKSWKVFGTRFVFLLLFGSWCLLLKRYWHFWLLEIGELFVGCELICFSSFLFVLDFLVSPFVLSYFL